MLYAQLADPLGDIVGSISTVMQKGEKYLDLIVEVLEDPALPTVAAQVGTLRRITKSQASSAASSSSTKSTSSQITAMSTAMASEKGVGLRAAVRPLNWYIWYREHKAAAWALGLAAILVPVGLGVAAGRLSKRCRVDRAR